MIWLWFALGVLGYLAGGVASAYTLLPGLWENARHNYHYSVAAQRSYVAFHAWMTLLLWPATMTAYTLYRGTEKFIDLRDPQRAERERAARAKRIAELERETGL